VQVTGRLITATLGTGAVLFALAAPASAASGSSGQQSASLTPISEPGWAGYYTNDVEAQASTTFVVPRLNCSGNPAGSFAGQGLGVLFLSNYNGTTGPGHGPNSVVREYCVGHTAYYDTEFYFPNAAGTNEVAVSAGVPVRPGDLVETSVQVTASRSEDNLINLSDGRDGFAQQTGPGVTDAAPDVGLAALSGDASGPTDIGSPGASSPPAPSNPVLFLGSQIGNQPLTRAAGLGAQEWTNPSDASEVWAAPSALFADSFAVTITP
jgi:hypothetical protein